MSERSSPGAAENAADRRPEALTPEGIERVLADFRAWLEETARRSTADLASPPPVNDDELEPVDLHTLLGQMVALRHEVHLQTRGVRAQQEQNADTLQQLAAALETLRVSSRQTAETPGDELLRPLLKTVIELYDALALAAREVQRVQETVLAAPAAEERMDPIQQLLDLAHQWEAARSQPRPPAAAPSGLLARLFGTGRPPEEALAAEREALAAEARMIAALREVLATQIQRPAAARDERLPEMDPTRRLLESLVAGYTMSVQRVERTLWQYDLEPIPCVGEPFDPERMEVLEVAIGTGRPSGEVVEEVRRGYLWRGRVFRCAQVRVARS
jgi:molecular chaperone GrpE